jgi:Carboxypeptidase regulatory-like domain
MTMWLPVWLALAIAQVAGAQGVDAQVKTCEIRGQITDRDTGMPIARALVRVRMEQSSNEYVARSDADGRYRITGLPAGAYNGFVQGGEFRATYQMQGLQNPARGPLRLEPGEVRTGIDVALQRTLAMTVRVVDEWGGPLSRVSVVVKSVDTGRQAFGGLMGSMRTTDDRGRIRIYGLLPGRYIVCADRSQMFPPSDAPTRDRFLPTCAPSAATDGEAEPVRLARADVDGVTIQMRRGRTFTISGMVLDASGAPADRAQLSLSVFTANGSSSRGISVDAGGRFTIANVPPGDYALEASLGGPNRPEHRRDLEVAFQPIRVDASDLDDIIVTMAKGVEVAGRIVLEDSTAAFQRATGYGPVLIRARLANDWLAGTGSTQSTYYDYGADRVFSLDGMFGRRVIEVINLPPGWYVKSIMYKGNDIFGVATEFSASKDPSLLEVLVSNRGALITGRVLDERGDPVRGARVLAIPADPSKWNTIDLPSVASSATGAYRIGPRRRGEYLVVAVESKAQVPYGNRDQIARLAGVAERVTLVEDEERTLDLRVVRVRP